MKVNKILQKLFLSVLLLAPFAAQSAEVGIAVAIANAMSAQERAGITYLRQFVSDIELEYYKTKQVPEELAQRMDEVFGDKRVQRELFYNLKNKRPNDAEFLVSQGFWFSGTSYVFRYKKFPGLIFKIATDGVYHREGLHKNIIVGRVLKADIINAIAKEQQFKVLRAVNKQLYFAKHAGALRELCVIVVEPEIFPKLLTSKEEFDEAQNFVQEAGLLRVVDETLVEDCSYFCNAHNGVIFDSEDFGNRISKKAEFYLTRYFPEFVKQYKAKKAAAAQTAIRARL